MRKWFIPGVAATGLVLTAGAVTVSPADEPVKAVAGPIKVPADLIKGPARTNDPAPKPSKPLPSVEAVKRHAGEAMEKLRTGDVEGMFSVLKEHTLNNYTLQNFGTLDGYYRKTREGGYLITGDAVGEIERVREEALGSSFVRLTYLEKFERQVIVIRLIYYRANKNWNLYDISWDLSPQTQNVVGLFAPTALPVTPQPAR